MMRFGLLVLGSTVASTLAATEQCEPPQPSEAVLQGHQVLFRVDATLSGRTQVLSSDDVEVGDALQHQADLEPPQPVNGNPIYTPTGSLLEEESENCPAGSMLIAGTCAVRPATMPELWTKVHNIFRCMHGSKPVAWSAAAAASAEAYVASLTTLVHSNSYRIPPPAGPAGENLAMGFPSPEAAISAWYNEVTCCQSFPGCQTGSCVTGHFTALVWAGVSEIGCARNSRRIDICRYRSGDTLSSRTANMGGAYTQNVFARTKDAQTCIRELEGGAAPGGPVPAPAPQTSSPATSTTVPPTKATTAAAGTTPASTTRTTTRRTTAAAATTARPTTTTTTTKAPASAPAKPWWQFWR